MDARIFNLPQTRAHLPITAVYADGFRNSLSRANVVRTTWDSREGDVRPGTCGVRALLAIMSLRRY